MKSRVVAGLFTLLLSIVLSSSVSAEENNGFPGCGIYSDTPIEFTVKEPLQQKFSFDLVTIQCGAAGNTWNGIKSSARLTNDTGRVLNYEK